MHRLALPGSLLSLLPCCSGAAQGWGASQLDWEPPVPSTPCGTPAAAAPALAGGHQAGTFPRHFYFSRGELRMTKP